MLKKILWGLAVLSALASCKKGFKETETGLEYVLYEDKEGDNAKVGDYLTLHFAITAVSKGKDTLIRDTWKEGFPVSVSVQKSTFKGALEEGLLLVSVGDSVGFKVNADSMFQKTFMTPLPEFIDKGSKLTFVMRVLKLQGKEAYEKEQIESMEKQKKMKAENAVKQKEIDDQRIQQYIQEKGLKASITPSGVAYVITEAGKGPNAKAGDMVTVHYKGALLDGTVFDASFGKEPLQFVLGRGDVIPGWDEGITLFNKGAKGTILIPSRLGYGDVAMGETLPANSILVFDIELIKIGK